MEIKDARKVAQILSARDFYKDAYDFFNTSGEIIITNSTDGKTYNLPTEIKCELLFVLNDRVTKCENEIYKL